uniref:Flavonoid 3'-monooxygenase n=1 Tax=Ananas comosus var. bracteatus TaxID=296719 RepID=A0A6V7P5J4_ANACO|nr:unnamed protein product [Ananas comosus var. bracteatus]
MGQLRGHRRRHAPPPPCAPPPPLRRPRQLPQAQPAPGPKPWPIIGNLNLIGALPTAPSTRCRGSTGPSCTSGSGPSRRGGVVGRRRQILPQNARRRVHRPAEDGSRQVHDVQLLRHHVVALRGVLAAGAEDVPDRAVQRPAARLVRVHPEGRNPEPGARPARGCCRRRRARAAEGLPVDRQPERDQPDGAGKKYLDPAEAAGAVVSPEEFKWMLDELFLLNGVLNIGDSIPWLDFLDLQGYIKRMKKLSKKFDRFLEHVLDEHNERRWKEGEEFVAKDMVDVLLQLADDPTLEVKLKRDGVKAFTQDLIAGGTESSAVTVEWAISELLKQPEIFAKATEELDRVIGRDRWVEEKEVHKLPYVEAIVKETMRLHPVAPMLVPRLSREDSQINGYDIPRARAFLGSPIDVKGHDFELLPFGSGRRMCPGYSLGLKVIQVSLANLLHGFAWRLPDGRKREDLSMEEIFGLSTPRKEPLVAIVEPKLPEHLYDL